MISRRKWFNFANNKRLLWLFLIAINLCEFITIISNFESKYKYDNSIKYSVRIEFSKIRLLRRIRKLFYANVEGFRLLRDTISNIKHYIEIRFKFWNVLLCKYKTRVENYLVIIKRYIHTSKKCWEHWYRLICSRTKLRSYKINDYFERKL